MSARDEAIKRLEDFVQAGGSAQAAVDAIIEAARAPESEHTRRVTDAIGTTGGKATVERQQD